MSSGCFHPKNCFGKINPRPAKHRSTFTVGFTDFDPFFRAKGPVWGTKNPRADLFFLTRPLRPQLNSQLVYPNCTGCQRCFFTVSGTGIAQRRLGKSYLSWKRGPTLCPDPCRGVAASTYNLAKNVLQNLLDAGRQCNNFFKKISAVPVAFPVRVCHSKEQGR